MSSGPQRRPESGGVTSCLQASVIPVLRKEREERGTHCIADRSEIKGWATADYPSATLIRHPRCLGKHEMVAHRCNCLVRVEGVFAFFPIQTCSWIKPTHIVFGIEDLQVPFFFFAAIVTVLLYALNVTRVWWILALSFAVCVPIMGLVQTGLVGLIMLNRLRWAVLRGKKSLTPRSPWLAPFAWTYYLTAKEKRKALTDDKNE